MGQQILKNAMGLGFLLVLGAVIVYFNQENIQNGMWRLYTQYFPCRSPISYQIGDFDTRFGISKADFLSAARKAEALWEDAYGKDLLTYKEDTGRLAIHLRFDERQAITQKLDTVDATIDAQEHDISSIESRMDMAKSALDAKKAEYRSWSAAFDGRQSAYASKVSMWNRKGGAPNDIYQELQTEKAGLEQEAEALKRLVDEINQGITAYNALVAERNEIAGAINEHVDTYNEIGAERGDEFTEGEYIDGPRGVSISIYEFDTTEKLVRLLAHEFGHALGIDGHVEDKEAIMYYLNNGKSLRISADDLLALGEVCGA